PPVPPPNHVARRLLPAHLLDPPCPTGLGDPLRLDDDAVSDVSLHVSSPRGRLPVPAYRDTLQPDGSERDPRTSRDGSRSQAGHPRSRRPPASRPDLLRRRGRNALLGGRRAAQGPAAAPAALRQPSCRD